MKKNIIFSLLLLVLTGCEKLKKENVIPEDAVRLNELKAEYMDILTGSPEGWYIEYAPSEGHAPISILLRFSDEGNVQILSDMYGFNETKTSTYRVDGVTQPELIFDTYSIWSAITEDAGGGFEFLMYPQEDGRIVLKNIISNTDESFLLRKATATDKNNIIAQSRTAQLLATFNDNASAYFKNLVLENIAAFWEININTQQLTLTWEENGLTNSKTFSYANLPDGIRLNEAWTVKNISVTEIRFGSVNGSTLEVLEAGNAGPGQIEVAHVPAFPYPGTADLFLQDGGAERFYAYTIDDLTTYYSPNLISAFLQFKAATAADIFRLQIYNNNPVGSGRNSLQMRYILPSDESGWMAYYHDIEKVGESHVVVSLTGETNSVAAPYLDAAQTFFDVLFPPEGVTIVPFGRAGSSQRLRLVSRKDSRNYVTITVGTPAGQYVD